MELISLKEVVQHLDSGLPVASISFVTYDKNRKTGGKLITLENVTSTFTKSPRKALPPAAAPAPSSDPPTRHPNHWRNRTRNLILPGQRIPRKVHILLITRFCGKIVHY